MICWIDAAAGASGDMFLGALAGAGVPVEVLQDAVDALGTEPVRLRAAETSRHGLAAIKVDVDCPPSTVDRRYTAIVRLINQARLPQPVKDSAVETFTRLGRAEAAAHRVPLEEVHFHEVGALDSLADVVAACAGLHWLAVHRGVSTVVSSPVTAGGGVTRGAHGGIPLPAPATLAVLAEAKAPVAGEVGYEACTPTGAAIIAAHASGYGLMPLMTVSAIGVGAGGRDPAERANVLRLVLGEPVTQRRAPTPGEHGHGHALADGTGHGHVHEHDQVHENGEVHAHGADPEHGRHRESPQSSAGGDTAAIGPDGRPNGPGRAVVLEANIDDCDPRLWPHIIAALLDSGASDAWLSPILMKKGRAAHTLHVLCRPEAVTAVRAAVFANTTTIGLRVTEIGKFALDREYDTVDVDGRTVAVKLARDAGRIVNVSVEHDDVVAAAAALGRPVKVVLAQATAAAADRYGAA